MNNKKIGVGIDLIITRDDKILLGMVSDKWKTKEGEWGLPGHDLLFGDTFEECIKRNLKNELGMTIESYKIISINNNFWLGNHYVTIGVIVDSNDEPKLINNMDWKKWEWFEKDKLPEKICPPAKLTLECLLENKITVSE